MKKTIASFSVFFLMISEPLLFAQMAVPMPAIAQASGLERVGVVAAAGGKVELTTPGQVGRIAQSGQAIFLGDEVRTDALGHLQILLLDETVFTIGPNSTIIIDKFVYDPKSQKGEIKASITKGVFRYVSGKIAAKNPDAVKVKLPAATLGFRGTIVGGSVGGNGQGLAALLGPGSNNDAGAPGGNFTIEGTDGGFQSVSRTGFGVEFDGNGGVSGVFQLSGDQINGLTGGLGGGAPGSGGQGSGGGNENGFGGDGNMGNLSGENNVLGGMNGNMINGISGFADGLYAQSVIGAQEAAQSGVSGVKDGITQSSDLSTITSGVFHYYATGTYYGSGTMTAEIDIDFSSKTIVGGNSYVSISDGAYSDKTAGMSTPVSFGSSGDATFHWTNVSGSSGTFTNINITLFNSGGVVAEQATVKVDYVPISVGPASGSGSAEGPRLDGPTPDV